MLEIVILLAVAVGVGLWCYLRYRPLNWSVLDKACVEAGTSALPTEAPLIAHACGEIEGHRYTNCLEALHQSVQAGYRFIEIDLLLTKDGYLVAGHTWEDVWEMAGLKGKARPLSLAEFKKLTLYGRYRVMDGEMVRSFFSEHPELILVTDKIGDGGVLKRTFHDIVDRVWVEVTPKHYRSCRAQGFRHVLLSAQLANKGKERKFLRALSRYGIHDLEWLVVSEQYVHRDIYRLLRDAYHIRLAVATVNDPAQIKAMLGRGDCDLIYTDSCRPGEL